MDHVWGGYPCVSNYHNFPALSPPLIGKWIIPRMRTCLYLHNRYAHVYIYIPRMCIYLNYLYLLSRMRTCLYLHNRYAHVYIYIPRMCLYLNYLQILSRMRTCLYYRIFTAKHAPCRNLHVYIYIPRICIYLYIYIYFHACATSKFT